VSVRGLATSFIFSFLVIAATAAAQTPAGLPAGMPACEGGMRWIVNAGSLQHSQTEFPLDLQKKYFDSGCAFLVIGDNPSEDYRDWMVVKTRTATSLATVEVAAADPSTTAVLYDPEEWDMTPPEEQRDPAGAACRAASVVRAHNKILIVTPAINLIRIIEPGTRGNRFEAFAGTKLAGEIARCADVYEIQAQGAEMDKGAYRSFVEAEARQARAANPHVVVMAGISTNPTGQQVSGKEVFEAVQAVRNVVDGFWLNIPGGGKFCPSCGAPQPKVAVDMLQRLDAR
jgi:hypothetical protein